MKKRANNGTVVIYDKEHQTVIVDKIIDNDADTIEMHGYILPLNAATTYVDPVHGQPVHVYNLDVPALTEAEALKKLRRSQALKNMFAFERKQDFDLMKMMPWVAIALLILFK